MILGEKWDKRKADKPFGNLAMKGKGRKGGKNLESYKTKENDKIVGLKTLPTSLGRNKTVNYLNFSVLSEDGTIK